MKDHSGLGRFTVGTRVRLWKPGHRLHGVRAIVFLDSRGCGAEVREIDHAAYLAGLNWQDKLRALPRAIQRDHGFLYLTDKEFVRMQTAFDVMES